MGGGAMFVLNSMNLGQSLIILEAAWIWGHVLYGMIIHLETISLHAVY